MDKKLISIFILVALVIVAGCQPTVTSDDNESDLLDFVDINVSDDTMSTDDNVQDEEDEVDEPEEIDESKASFRIETVEGELAEIPVKAVDPDGDFLEYTFEDPFNEQGLWQTKIGDEGKYLVKVSVTDGKLSTSEFVLVEVLRANRPPTIECDDDITVQETETVYIDCNIYDVDGDVVLTSYDGWMKTEEYETTYGDEGTHTVVVRAKDKEGESFKEITINVLKKNRAPVFEDIEPITSLETELIRIEPVVQDPDGDDVEITFSKPFDDDGEWEPTFGDAGEYEVTVTADDGTTTTEQTVEVTVERKNRPPVLKEIDDIEVEEGETVEIPVNTFDPDGDDVIVSYSGWMDSSEYETTYDDANPNGCDEKGCTAEYTVTVRATDGVLSVTQDVTISVEDKNRPPEFIFG